MEGLLDFSSDDSGENEREKRTSVDPGKEKVASVRLPEDEAVSRDSGQRLRLRGEGEQWCGGGGGGGEKK